MSALFNKFVFKVLLVVIVFTFTTGCTISSDGLLEDVTRAHEKRYQGAELLKFRWQRLPTPQGALGISVFVRMDYQQDGMPEVGQSFWHCERSFGASWTCNSIDAKQVSSSLRDASVPSVSFAVEKIAITAGNFSFKVPKQWVRASDSDEKETRSVLTVSTAAYADYGDFFVFNSPDDYMFIIYDLVFRGPKPTLEEGLSANKKNFETGISQGIVKSVRSNKLITVGDKTVLENDWIGNTKKKNNRNLIYVIDTPNSKVNVNISAFFAASDDDVLDQVREVLQSIDGH